MHSIKIKCLQFFSENKVVKIKVTNKSKHQLPTYYTPLSAGMNLRADMDEEIVLKPMERAIVKNGIFLEIPVGCKRQIRPRSVLAFDKGITILKSPGTIDAGDRCQVCIILINLTNENFVIKEGERICQMVIAKQEKPEWLLLKI